MKDIVVVTATYNRENTLNRLYKSLLNQKNKNFDWLIIDDGSTDNTKKFIEKIKKDNLINIIYIYQNNSGKGKAINTAFEANNGAKIYAIVDSDDFLLDSAIGTIEKYLYKYYNISEVGAFFFHYKNIEGEKIINKKELEKDRILDWYIYNKLYGLNDGCTCYLDKVIKKYRYPIYENEKYIGPSVLPMEFSKEYKIVFSPKIIGIAEYQKNGLTKSGRKLRLSNPNGMIHYCNLLLDSKSSLKNKIKAAISIWAYYKKSDISFKDFMHRVKKPFFVITFFLPGYILYLIWNNKYS